MENLKCQATEFGFCFMVVRNCWGIPRGSYTTTAAWRLCTEWTGEGSETEGREGYSKSAEESLDGGCGRGQAEYHGDWTDIRCK